MKRHARSPADAEFDRTEPHLFAEDPAERALKVTEKNQKMLDRIEAGLADGSLSPGRAREMMRQIKVTNERALAEYERQKSWIAGPLGWLVETGVRLVLFVMTVALAIGVIAIVGGLIYLFM